MSAIPPPALPPAPPPGGPAQLHRLAASLAHNVNNALTGVIGNLELALQRAGRDEEAEGFVRSGLECAHLAADAVRRLVGCAHHIAEADPPAPHSLRWLAQEAAKRHAAATAAGHGGGQVFVSAGLVGLTLDALVGMLAADGGPVTLRAAEEGGRGVLYAESAGAAEDLPLRLLEASLMTEIQGGALEVLSPPGRPAEIRISFPCLGRPPLRRDEAQPGPAAPHLSAALGLLRPAV